MHRPFSAIGNLCFQHHGQTVCEIQQRESLCFCFLLSCACVSVNTFLSSRVAELRALSALYLNKLPVNVPCWRICACALAEPDTILLWQNGKHLQCTACLVLSDGKIKANPNKIHSLQLWVGRWRDHQRGTARSTMSSDHIIIDLSCSLPSVFVLLGLNCAFTNISHGSLLPLISWVWHEIMMTSPE